MNWASSEPSWSAVLYRSARGRRRTPDARPGHRGGLATASPWLPGDQHRPGAGSRCWWSCPVFVTIERGQFRTKRPKAVFRSVR